LDRAEILGRLAKDFSPSFIAHLVKTRGISFSPTSSFLSQVKLAGGDGILIDRLSSSDSSAQNNSSLAESLSVEHLAKCAEFMRTGATESAELECRASIEENPASPWPLLLTADLLVRNFPAYHPDFWDEKRHAEQAELLRRADTLDPQRITTSELEPGGANPYMFLSNNDGNNSQQILIPDGLPSGPTIQGGALKPAPLDLDLAHSHRLLAYNSFRARDFENAEHELKEAIRLEPDFPGNHTCLAFLYISGQSQTAAIAELREAVRVAPSGIEQRETLSQMLQQYGRTPEAISELRNLLAINPRPIEPSDALIDLFLQQKDIKSAITELQRSLKATSSFFSDEAKFVQARFWDISHLGALLRQNREFDAAAEQYLLLLHYQPENASVHNDYGNVLLDQHRIDDALAEYNEAIRLDPDTSAAHNNVGLCLALKKNLNGAIDEFHHALELNPDEPNTRIYLGTALGQAGDMNAAMEQFQQAIEKNPKDTFAHTQLAYALMQLKDTPGAIKELKIALDIRPDSPDAQNDLAWIYATADDPKLRNPTEALVLAQKAVKGAKAPNPAFLDTLAEALLLNGQPVEAFAIETQAAKLDPQSPDIQSRLPRFRDAANQNASTKP
jgi:tetratricopeptide (TPR) repeat protein